MTLRKIYGLGYTSLLKKILGINVEDLLAGIRKTRKISLGKLGRIHKKNVCRIKILIYSKINKKKCTINTSSLQINKSTYTVCLITDIFYSFLLLLLPSGTGRDCSLIEAFCRAF